MPENNFRPHLRDEGKPVPAAPQPEPAEPLGQVDDASSRDAETSNRDAASPARLLFIPLVLVSAAVVVWLFVRWPGRATVSPRDLVRDLGRPGKSHWQQAYALAELLRSPQHAELKRDAALAAELAALLQAQLDAGQPDTNRINLQVFLCRALGEFAVPGVQPVLVRASRLERTGAEIAVRRAAVEALAAQAAHARTTDSNAAAVEALLAAARENSAPSADTAQRAELRSSAAFALGVFGGPAAMTQLQVMLDDPSSNVRYNAAIGLARHGHASAAAVLLEMLEPGHPDNVAGAGAAAGRAWKQTVVLANAIRAAQQWCERNPEADHGPLTAAIKALARGDLPPAVQDQARQTLAALSASPRAQE